MSTSSRTRRTTLRRGATLLAALVSTALVVLPSSATAERGTGGTGTERVPVHLDADRLGDGSGPAAAPAPAAATAARRRDPDLKVKHVTVAWDGSDPRRKRDYTASARVPGVGQLKLVCKPDNTMLKIVPDDRNAETTMWLAKYETKNGNDVVAVKDVRVYRYDTAEDDGTGGTGKAAHEGLNQTTPIEDFAAGYADGVISTRPGRNLSGGAATPVPATSIKFNWWWEHFAYPLKERRCAMDATLTTDMSQAAVLTWHGDQDAPGRTQVSTQLPGLGSLELRCDAASAGEPGATWVTLRTDDPEARVFAKTIYAEGKVNDHVDEDSLDAGGGQVGPLDLPENGMMELNYTAHGQAASLFLSSYWIVNDDEHPTQNLCEVAAAPF